MKLSNFIEKPKITARDKFISVAVLVFFALQPQLANCAPLTLEQFLGEVQAGNDSYKSSKMTGEAAPDKAIDAEMAYAPTIFANAQNAIDKKELKPASQRGTETDYASAQFGVSKMTSFGTAAKLYYTASHTKIQGTSPQFIPEPEWRETTPTLEITHPLWKNAFGRDIANGVELQKGQAEISQLTETLKQKVTLAEAEGTYWRLVLARESIRVSKDNLERAKKIIDWTKRRVAKELADNADLIQAEALGELREIELTMAIDEERSAAFAFNTSRGNPSPNVKEELLKLTPELIAKLPTPTRTGDREDVRAAAMAASLSNVAVDLAGAKYQPSIDIFASGTLNGRDPDSNSKANSNALKSKHATYAMGLKVSAVLGGESFSRLRAGVAKEREAAILTASRRRFENEREWIDLSLKLQESKSRLSLTQKIEATQLKKLTAERERQSRGRSTMFQVMQAETDYASSQLNVVRNKAEILGIIARMKTFGGSSL